MTGALQTQRSTHSWWRSVRQRLIPRNLRLLGSSKRKRRNRKRIWRLQRETRSKNRNAWTQSGSKRRSESKPREERQRSCGWPRPRKKLFANSKTLAGLKVYMRTSLDHWTNGMPLLHGKSSRTKIFRLFAFRV